VPGDEQAYQVGVIQAADGHSFDLSFDAWAGAGGMVEKVGKNCEKLAQEYSAQVAEIEAQELLSQGWTMERQTQANGDIQIVLVQ